MLNTDLCMSIEAEPAKRGRGRNRKSRRNVEETAYHFNAFVPINNELYRLDGLEQHPQSLGNSADFPQISRLDNTRRTSFRVRMANEGQV